MEKTEEEIKQIFNIFTSLQENYKKNITASMKNHNQLTSIFKENCEKYSCINKRLEKLKRLLEENKIKTEYDNLRNVQRKYADKTISINNQEKNFFGNLFKNILNKNEEEVKDNQKIKNAMLTCISNCLKNLNFEEIKKNETKEGIDYVKEKYKNFFENSAKNYEDENFKKLKQIVGTCFLLNLLDDSNSRTNSPNIKPKKMSAININSNNEKNNNEIIKKLNAKERNSIMNKNNLEIRLFAIYADSPNLPQIEFKKISENEFIYGTIKVKINTDPRNANSIIANWKKNAVNVNSPLEEFLKQNAESENEKVKKKIMKKNGGKKN